MKGKWGRSLALALFRAATLLHLPAQSQDLVAQAWQAWESNNQKQVELKFLAAIQANANETRAYFGLALLYRLQAKPDLAWKFFQQGVSKSDAPYPHLFSAWLSGHLKPSLVKPESGALKTLEALTQKADEGGVLKAMANDVLAEHYQARGELDKARRYYQNVNAIKTWTVIGPFDNTSASGYDNVYPPETEYDPGRTYEGKNGIPAKWFAVTATRNDAWIDHLRYFAYTSAVYYGNTFVYSPQKQAVQLRIGTSGSLKAFLNDELALEYFDENNNDLDTYIVATELQAGWNRVLVKCGYSEINQCNFAMRITDERGEPIAGLKVSLEPQSYSKRPGAPSKLVPNFAETFFQAQIKTHPDRLENYALLADCYLRNDKAIEAELTIRTALERSPNCAYFYEMLVEAFLRGEKYDEVSTVREKMLALDKDIPSVLEYKIERYLDNEDFAPAEELIKRYTSLLPDSPKAFELNLTYYTKKKQFDKVLGLAHSAYTAHPEHWTFAYIEAAFSLQATRKYDEAIKIMQDYLKRDYQKFALVTLADFYLKASKVDKWEETFEKALELDPSATGYRFNMTEVYVSLQRYAQAEEAIRKALAICPNSSDYWAKLGAIKRMQGDSEAAKQAYREALRFRPTNYGARETLRELEGKKSVFANFEDANITELIRTAPAASAYPENHGVILLSEAKRVVYEQGASEYQDELLVKLFDSDGLDAYKEYWIGYNSYTETLTIDKAVVIKKDGAEIEADISNNHVVFKSLEENDCIYLKWRIKNYYSGKLSNHFWDTFYFNGFYPVKQTRYSLLVPKSRKFQWKAQNFTLTPAQRETEDGVLYQWSLENEPAVVYEVGMPTFSDAGKILHLSSIGDWEYLVQWYSELTRTKTRGSHEIKTQVQELFKGRNDLSEEERIRSIYTYITENIRYSSVPFRQSGLVPQEARDVLVTKIGDCKDMATLCIAMLNEAGLKAHYVLLNTKDDGLNREVPPSIAFNHCVAGVETKQGLKYLDLTAADYALGTLPESDLEGFSLLIRSEVKTPHYLSRAESERSTTRRKITAEIRADNSLLMSAHTRKTGAPAASMRSQYRLKSLEERKKGMTQSLSDEFLNPKITKFVIEGLDSLRATVDYDYDFEVANYATEPAQLKLFKLPWLDALTSHEGLAVEERKFSYSPWLWADTLAEKMELRIPSGWTPMEPQKSFTRSCAVAEYSVSYRFANGVLRAERKLVCKNRTVSAEAFAQFKKFYGEVVREDGRQIVLKQ